MPAFAGANAIPDRVLQNAGHSHRLAAGTLAVDTRPVCKRLDTAADHGGQHVPHAADDSAAGNGSDAAAHDELHDAGHDARLFLLAAGWPASSLCGEQLDHDCPTVDHEPHQVRAR